MNLIIFLIRKDRPPVKAARLKKESIKRKVQILSLYCSCNKAILNLTAEEDINY